MSFGVRMKTERERRNWSQKELACVAQVDHAWISKLEAGDRFNISLEAAIKIAYALGVSLDHLARDTVVVVLKRDAVQVRP